MKKILVIILILSIIILSNTYTDKTLINVVASKCEKYEILTNENECQIVKIEGKNIDEILKSFNVEIINKINISDRVIIEGYTNCLNDYINIDNMKVNIQIAVCKDYLIIGCPLIKNSF